MKPIGLFLEIFSFIVWGVFAVLTYNGSQEWSVGWIVFFLVFISLSSLRDALKTLSELGEA